MSNDENITSLSGALKLYLRPADDDEYWGRLEAAHEQEGIRRRIEFTNFGWFTDADAICSKTNKGYLTSSLCRTTGKAEHHWKPYKR
jgi:hypothetical protein